MTRDWSLRSETAVEVTPGDLSPVLDRMHDAVLVLDAGDRVRYFNLAWRRMFGLADGEIVLGDDLRRVFEVLGRRGQIGGAPSETLGETVERRLGSWRTERDRHERRRFPDGRVIDIFRSRTDGRDVVCVHVDVTEQVRRQDELDRQRELMSSILENTQDGVALLDADGRFIAFNSRFLQLYDIEQGQVCWGMHFSEFASYFSDLAAFSPEDRTAEIARRFAFCSDIGAESVLRPLGNGRMLEVRKSPLPGTGDCVLTVRDATDTLHRERALTEARLKAEAANRHKSDFVARMSHEMRTPLHGVLGPAALLARTTLDPRQQRLVDAIATSGEMLLRLIDDVLDLSRLEVDGLELIERPLAICEVMRECLAMIETEAAARGLELIKDPSPEKVPPVLGDAVRLRQVMLNLLTNAVKFTDTGSVTMRLRAEVGQDSLIARMSVSDTGIGIARRDRERVFHQFIQVDQGMTRRHGGAGLGLTITRRLVEAMGGEITLESEVGQGSCFTVILPFRLLTPRAAPTAAGD